MTKHETLTPNDLQNAENSTILPPSLNNKPKEKVRSMRAAVLKLRNGITFLKAHKKELFWYWIGYQCVKGTLTTSFIWIPLLYKMMH